MTPNNENTLFQTLVHDYQAMYPTSKDAHMRARDVLVSGISHGARTFDPYPFRIAKAQGAYVTDLDGHEILDFWQGHYANILGHNPDLIRNALIQDLQAGYGLQTGFPDERQTTFAGLLARALDAERVRLTTSGTLATMYAIMLARAFTGRQLVVKIGGGWHGANPLALKGVHRTPSGFDQVDSTGVPVTTEQEILITRFNDVEGLRALFEAQGERIACFIFEPCPGSSGFIPASAEFMRTARALTQQYGALLILDEVITGFRFCASGVQRLYGVKADLTTLGKIIGGGMPVAAVAGRGDVMALAGEEAAERVWFNGGTYSGHPLSLLAGQVMVEHLMTHEAEIYPALAAYGERLRRGIEKVFADRGIAARCTGHPNGAIEGSSLFGVYFPRRDDLAPTAPEDVSDPALCDVALRDREFKLGLLLHGVNLAHGRGAVATAHTEAHLEHVWEACDAFAKRYLAAR